MDWEGLAASMSGMIIGLVMLYCIMAGLRGSIRSRDLLNDTSIEERSIAASNIKQYYVKNKETVDYHIVKRVLDNSEICISENFPDGPFTVRDMAAIAMVESNFSQFAVGQAGERGVFQILNYKDELKELGLSNKNIFDIDINAKVACHEIRKKYDRYRDYYKSIIAYNGYRVIAGKPDDSYWKHFVTARELMEEVWYDSK